MTRLYNLDKVLHCPFLDQSSPVVGQRYIRHTMADQDTVAPALKPDQEDESVEVVRKRTLGNVRLRHHQTNEIILIPTPSNDPNDPLNWYTNVLQYSRYCIISNTASQAAMVQVVHCNWYVCPLHIVYPWLNRSH